MNKKQCPDCGAFKSKVAERCRKCANIARHGHMVSTETREKISKSLKGKSPSSETRAKLSAVLKGRKLGSRPHSEETRKKMSESAKRREAKHIAKLHAANISNGRYHKIGDKVIDNKGYVLVKYRHFNGSSNWRHEHRIIMEHHLGRPLERSEHVHHIDGNKANNDISNLAMLSARDHRQLSNVVGFIKKSDKRLLKAILDTINARFSES